MHINAGFERHFLYIHIFVFELAEDDILDIGAGMLVAKKRERAFNGLGILAFIYDRKEKWHIIAGSQLGHLGHSRPLQITPHTPKEIFYLLQRLGLTQEETA